MTVKGKPLQHCKVQNLADNISKFLKRYLNLANKKLRRNLTNNAKIPNMFHNHCISLVKNISGVMSKNIRIRCFI